MTVRLLMVMAFLVYYKNNSISNIKLKLMPYDSKVKVRWENLIESHFKEQNLRFLPIYKKYTCFANSNIIHWLTLYKSIVWLV